MSSVFSLKNLDLGFETQKDDWRREIFPKKFGNNHLVSSKTQITEAKPKLGNSNYK